TNPMVLKKELARTIIAMYHSNESARSAEQNFERVFSKKEIPDDIEEIVVASSDLPKLLVKALTDCGAVASNGEARRLIQQGGVRVNDEKINDVNYTFNQKGKYITKVGKRRFIKFIVN
ncbi:MAG: S4 domain-containing protein, partial [Candidatus Marinimicrobia bacterium]|nr:S4 domain-containing protein [Candidatus Neomarinimicrobiota bacterium]